MNDNAEACKVLILVGPSVVPDDLLILLHCVFEPLTFVDVTGHLGYDTAVLISDDNSAHPLVAGETQYGADSQVMRDLPLILIRLFWDRLAIKTELLEEIWSGLN